MANDKVTPIRPDMSIKAKKRKARGETQAAGIKEKLHDLQFRVGRACALTRAMALALDGQVLPSEIEAGEACLGVAEMLDGIRDEM
jgi:hypothetical protein